MDKKTIKARMKAVLEQAVHEACEWTEKRASDSEKAKIAKLFQGVDDVLDAVAKLPDKPPKQKKN